MSVKNLEDFRLNEYLVPHLFLSADKPEDGIEMSYNIYSIHAFYSTIDDIRDLEFQTTFVNNGRRSGISIALWFLSLESFINCLCKISCLKEKKDFFKYLSGKSINTRLDYVFSAFNIDGLTLKQSGLTSRLSEFQQFRNEVFHDRNFGERINFNKTNFSPLPFFSNQIDVFQALLIFLEISRTLRYCVKELDLMANVSIGDGDVLIFDKLDKLYTSFLHPYFEATLKKHNLQTQLDLNIESFPQPQPDSNNYFKRGEVLPVFRMEQREEFKHDLSLNKTNIGSNLYKTIVASYDKQRGNSDSMNFMINWPKFYEDSASAKL